jgi:hypothetical protein
MIDKIIKQPDHFFRLMKQVSITQGNGLSIFLTKFMKDFAQDHGGVEVVGGLFFAVGKTLFGHL